MCRWIHIVSMIMLGMATTSAVPVLSSLGQPAVDGDVAVSLNAWQASSFTIGNTATSWVIDAVSLRLTEVTPNQNLTLLVTGESSFRPDLNDVKVRFDTPSIPETGVQTIRFPARSTPTPVLAPGSTYWLVLGVTDLDLDESPSTGLVYWSFAQANDSDAGVAAGWSFGAQTASAGTAGSLWTPESTTPFSCMIEARRVMSSMTLSKWRARNPGGPSDEETFLSSDLDGNGKTGLLEYAFDNDPDFEPRSVLEADGVMGITYVRWSQASDLQWEVQSSTTLGDDWDRVPESDLERTVALLGNEHERVVVRLKASPTRVFLKVKVTKS